MTKYKDTRFEFVKELETLPPTPGILEMIQEAKAGEYHDYKNAKYVCGKVAVSGKLRQEMEKSTGLTMEKLKLLKREIETGVYDEQADKEDQRMLNEIIKEMVNPK